MTLVMEECKKAILLMPGIIKRRAYAKRKLRDDGGAYEDNKETDKLKQYL